MSEAEAKVAESFRLIDHRLNSTKKFKRLTSMTRENFAPQFVIRTKMNEAPVLKPDFGSFGPEARGFEANLVPGSHVRRSCRSGTPICIWSQPPPRSWWCLKQNISPGGQVPRWLNPFVETFESCLGEHKSEDVQWQLIHFGLSWASLLIKMQKFFLFSNVSFS